MSIRMDNIISAGEQRPLVRAGSDESVSIESPRSAIHPAAINAQKLYHDLVAQVLPKNSKPLISGAAGSVPDCAADYSYIIRQYFNNQYMADFPSFQLAGQTTAFNAVQGSVATAKAYARFQDSRARGNSWGKIEAGADIFRGIFQGLGGFSYTIYRPLSIYTSMAGIDTSSLQVSNPAGRATYMVGAVGSGSFGAFYAAIIVWAAVSLRTSHKFASKLYEEGRNIQVVSHQGPSTVVGRIKALFGLGVTPIEQLRPYMQFLGDKRLKTTGENTLDKLYKHAVREAKNALRLNPKEQALDDVKAALRKETAFMVKSWIRTLYNEENKLALKELHGTLLGGLRYSMSSSPTDKECEEIATRLFADNDTEKTRSSIIDQLGFTEGTALHTLAQRLSFEELTGLGIVTARRGLKKEGKLAQVSSDTLVTGMKEALASHLLERLASSDPFVKQAAEVEAQELMKKLKMDLFKNKAMTTLLLFSGILGLIGTVLGFIYTAGVGAAASGALFLATGLCMLPVDMTSLISGLFYSTEKPGKYDKALTGFNTAVALGSLATLVILGFVVGGVFSFGTVPMIVALTVCALFIASNSLAIYGLHLKEEKYNRENPTLESLKKTVSQKTETDSIDEEMRSLLKHLPKVDRGHIKASIAGTTERGSRVLMTEEDRALDRDFKFGENFFDKYPMHVDVLKAVEKMCKEKETMGVRVLLERMRAFKKSQSNENYTAEQLQEIRSCFISLSQEEKTGIAQKIYNRRAKHSISRRFKYEPVTHGQLKAALKEVLAHKQMAKQAHREAERSSRHRLYDVLSPLRAS